MHLLCIMYVYNKYSFIRSVVYMYGCFSKCLICGQFMFRMVLFPHSGIASGNVLYTFTFHVLLQLLSV